MPTEYIAIPQVKEQYESGLSTKMVYSGGTGGTLLEYVGFSLPGSLDSEPKWRIIKIAYDENDNVVSKLFAGGTKLLQHIWDDRATYTYS